MIERPPNGTFHVLCHSPSICELNLDRPSIYPVTLLTGRPRSRSPDVPAWRVQVVKSCNRATFSILKHETVNKHLDMVSIRFQRHPSWALQNDRSDSLGRVWGRNFTALNR